MNDSDKMLSYVQEDYERSRSTLHDLLENGKEALQLAIQVANDTEHPKAIEALSNLMRNIADINDKLMDLNKKNRDLYERRDRSDRTALPAPQEGSAPPTIVFTGSFAELQRSVMSEKDVTPRE